jgi:hypothetical protein
LGKGTEQIQKMMNGFACSGLSGTFSVIGDQIASFWMK